MLIHNTYAIHLLGKVGLDKGQQLAKPYYVGGTPVRRKEFLQVQKNNREWQNQIMSLGLEIPIEEVEETLTHPIVRARLVYAIRGCVYVFGSVYTPRLIFTISPASSSLLSLFFVAVGFPSTASIISAVLFSPPASASRI